jgi:uncharacterized membrane protein YgcG
MRKLLVCSIALLLFLVSTSTLSARGGGGCLMQGTLVLTPKGTIPVEQLKPGDAVIGISRGSLKPARVQAVTTVATDHYIQIIVNGRSILYVTQEHPIEVKYGVFRMASALKSGDIVNIIDQNKLVTGKVTSLTRIPAQVPAYNLLVSPVGNYIANSIIVHNKGCFLPDTPIRMADGTEVSLSSINVNDQVLAFTFEGKFVPAVVQKILTYDVDEYKVLKAGMRILQVTNEHPFYVGNNTFKTLETLSVNDSIFIFDGNGFTSQRIESIETIQKKSRVYNLQTDAPHTYLANGVAVHNKGGGGGGGGSRGGGYSSSGHRSSSSTSGRTSSGSGADFFLIFFAISTTLIILVIIIARKRGLDRNLDYVYSLREVAGKRDKTIKLINFISKQDSTVAPETLKKLSESIFSKLQECWQSREYAPMKALLIPDLYDEHLLQIQGMLRNHEINMISDLKIDRIDLVNIRYTIKEQDREFTALITATAQDYYIDDRTKARLRGDESPAQFQEFWTFHYCDKKWLLREIEQTGESDILKEDNFVEQFTDKSIDQIYAETAGKDGPAGPWLAKDVETKETRIERMLNFLVQTDKLWDRKAMLLTSQNVFIKVTVAWESGDSSKIPAADLFPELADSLRKEIERNRETKISLEFRNLCVRKTELLLIKNLADNSKDEFVVRIRAHAQKIMKRNGVIQHQDQDVTPFEQYLTFGRHEKKWKLKEVLNSNKTQGLIKQENIDQESSPRQLEWYYQHKRAV